MIPDTLAIAPYYIDALNWGKGCGRYVAWGVFENESMEQMANRYLPMGVIDDKLNLSDVKEELITEYMGRSGTGRGDVHVAVLRHRAGVHRVQRRGPLHVGQVPRLRRQALRGWRPVPRLGRVQAQRAVRGRAGRRPSGGAGRPGQIGVAQSTLGRTAVRQIETLYIAGLMKDWVAELIEALKSGDSEYFREPSTITGSGTGFWEAPRGALYHSESIKDGKIEGYQIIIPTTPEPRAEERQRRERPDGAGAYRQPGGRHREADQRAAHGAQLRPLHGLRGAHHRAGDGQELRDRHEPLGGEVTWRTWHITAKRIRCPSSSRTGSTYF